MAGPHVAGAVALLISAEPDLANQVDSLERLLRSTTRPMTTKQECDGISGLTIPNNTYGYGNLDVYNAFLAVKGFTSSTKGEFEQADFTLYPNPASSTLHWKSEINEPIKYIEVFDLSGRKITTFSDVKRDQGISILGFDDGMYIFRISFEDTLISRKIFIAK